MSYVLVIDDDRASRLLVCDVLRSVGYEVVDTDNALRGIGLARLNAPAVILTDIQLPELDGMQALEELRADPRTAQIPVIAITALAMADDREKIMDAGFDAYLSKPLRYRDLIALVDDFVGRES